VAIESKLLENDPDGIIDAQSTLLLSKGVNLLCITCLVSRGLFDAQSVIVNMSVKYGRTRLVTNLRHQK